MRLIPTRFALRWLLDGGFGDAANVTYLIEMGYDVYTIAHNGKTAQALRKEVPDNAQWEQAGSRTQALDMARQTLGDCPYPVRLTLLCWPTSDEFKYSTLISFSDAEELPTAELFPTYHQRPGCRSRNQARQRGLQLHQVACPLTGWHSPPGPVRSGLLAQFRTLGCRLDG